VDDWGGIHVLYYRGRWDSTASKWKYKVKLANVPQFTTTSAVSVTVYDITDYEFDLNDSSIWVYFGGYPFIGDYMNTCASRGCQVFAGYIAPAGATGPVGVFLANALIPNSVCVPDGTCYANCDGSTATPILNVNDFICFQERYAAGDSYANCDNSTTAPVLNINDFVCFMQKYGAGCL
jgi:hypothetical protein